MGCTVCKEIIYNITVNTIITVSVTNDEVLPPSLRMKFTHMNDAESTACKMSLVLFSPADVNLYLLYLVVYLINKGKMQAQIYTDFHYLFFT